MWRVELLGKVQIVRGDTEAVIARFESRKVAALLARLALFPARVHPREELAALLWPDADRQGGLARLRHVLSSLGRQTLDGEARLGPLFVADRFSVRLGENVICDAVLFERAANQKRRDDARALYTGDLLPGFYDDWIVTEQERLRSLFDELSAPVPVLSASRAAPVSAAANGAVAEEAAAPVVSPATAPTARGFLPHYLTTFWGRETEKQALRELLANRRLITVVGPVGCGKTRFVVEFVRDLLETGDDPFEHVVFVPLGECAVPEHIVPRLRAALQLPPTDAAPLEQIALALDHSRVLLVLDDAEHLAEGQGGAAGEIIAALLARLPRARCIVSSRRLLHVPGEQAFTLEPLPLPGTNATEVYLDRLRQNPCIALLSDRAKTVRPDFAITPRNMEAAVRLCRELEGVPLAIELAAGRIRAFSLQQMCDQFADVSTSTSGETGARGDGRWALTTPPAFVRANKSARRHHSLHEAVGASWQLLGKRQQEFLAALSVLRGQWTLPFAAHISGETEETAHALLEELTDHSLLQLYLASDDAPDQQMRWALLQTVSDFAHRQLPDAAQTDLRRRLNRFVLDALSTGGGENGLLPSDLFVWEAALTYAIADGEADEALALCVAFNEVWLRIGSPQAALQTIQAALRLPNGAAHLRASACEVGSFFAAHVFDFAQCKNLAQTAWENAEQATGESAAMARASAYLARARAAYVRQEAPETIVPLLRDAENSARQIAPLATAQKGGEAAVGGNSQRAHLLTSILNLRGASQLRAGNYDDAETDLRAAQTVLEQQLRPSAVRINQVRFNRVSVAHQRGDLETALALLDACSETAMQTADLKLQAQIAQNRGAIYSQQERWSESVAVLREAVQKFQDLGMKYGLCYALWNLSRPLVQTGATKKGVVLMAFSRAFWQAQTDAFDASEAAYCALVFAKAAETALPDQIAAWQNEGQNATLGAAVALALDGE